MATVALMYKTADEYYLGALSGKHFEEWPAVYAAVPKNTSNGTAIVS